MRKFNRKLQLRCSREQRGKKNVAVITVADAEQGGGHNGGNLKQLK